MRRAALTSLSVAILVALGTAGCTSDGDNSGDGTKPPAASGSVSGGSSSKSASVLVQPTDLPTKVANSPSLRDAVVVTSCATAKNGWQARGTAKNERKSKFTYAVTVFFTTPSATVIGFGKTKVSVGAGKSARWTAKGKFPAVKDTKCVLRGVGKG